MALRVPLKWLNEYVDIQDQAPDDLAERLTLAGLEVESVERLGESWGRDTLLVGQVESVEQHPNADRLCLVRVAHGAATPLTVVTGAPNLLRYVAQALPATPLKVPLALAGAEVIDGHAEDGRILKLKPGNIRGVRSEGMVCSEKELGLSAEHEGILFLPDDAPVGMPLVDYLGEAVLEFDIKGGFAHLLCIYGVARETAALLGRPLRDDVLHVGRDSGSNAGPNPPFIRLEIEDPQLCPRYSAVLVEGLTVQPSPFWLQQRLLRAGMRPINAVVDATNYVMLELGQPLHAFDYKTLRGKSGGQEPMIRVRRAQAGEKMRTLDEVERSFDNQMQLITDGGGPVAVAGVMGGQDSEIADSTTTVLLESANFEFLNVRRTSQLLKLRTEASERFGKRLDPELCLTAALRCAHLIAELCGGAVRGEWGDLYPAQRAPAPIQLRVGFVNERLGTTIAAGEMVRILEALEFAVEGQDPLTVTPPSHRMDVAIPEDLVEEIGRIWGYDRMLPTQLADTMPPQQGNRALDGSERIRDLLTGCGLDEIITYTLISLEDERRLHPKDPGALSEADYVSVRNPLSAERGHLRRGLLGEALNTLRANLRFAPRVALFEIGSVFLPHAGQVLPDQPQRLCGVLAGPRTPAAWNDGTATSGRFDFFDAKGAVETVLQGLEITQVEWRPAHLPSYHPGRCAEVVVDGETIGAVGELHPRVTRGFDLPHQLPVAAFELDVGALLARWREDKQVRPLSGHPPVYEDLAFVVEAQVPAEQVRSLIAQTGGDLLRKVTLFDLYTGDQVEAGRKSLAYALTYQADDRTLTDKEVAKLRGRIVKRLEHELGAQLRG